MCIPAAFWCWKILKIRPSESELESNSNLSQHYCPLNTLPSDCWKILRIRPSKIECENDFSSIIIHWIPLIIVLRWPFYQSISIFNAAGVLTWPEKGGAQGKWLSCPPPLISSSGGFHPHSVPLSSWYISNLQHPSVLALVVLEVILEIHVFLWVWVCVCVEHHSHCQRENGDPFSISNLLMYMWSYFKRPGDLVGHKNFCGTQHQNNRSLEASTSCERTFHKKGDLTRHSRFCRGYVLNPDYLLTGHLIRGSSLPRIL